MIAGQPLYFVLLFIAASAVFAVPAAFRWMVVLATSVAFYWIYTGFSVLIFIPSLVSFYCARRIESAATVSARRIFLFISLAVNVGLLAFFKARGAFAGDTWILPLGLSFYSLQLTGYVLDVYWGRSASERRLGPFLSFAIFFPHLTAGPIERSTTLLPQMPRLPGYDHTRVRIGVLLILTGLIKKLAVADAMAPAVRALFESGASFSGGEILFGSVLARYALFFDFSGYTDIAIGSAAVLGIVSSPNFNRPFASHSIAEFWRRWHMTLSSWMKDYVFFPFITGPGV
jgi:D-alanyl-lipoteichoic acid acyltransferase DltB (MBOAT superfamily)